jgi:hypothetical protein
MGLQADVRLPLIQQKPETRRFHSASALSAVFGANCEGMWKRRVSFPAIIC